MHLWDLKNLQQLNAIPINEHVSEIPLTSTMSQKVALNFTIFCHVHRDNIQILPNIRHLASTDLKNSLAKSWQWSLCNYIDTTNHSGGKRFCVPLFLNVRGDGPPLRSTYHHLACEHQKVREDKEVIIKYMKQEFRFVYNLVQEASRRHPATSTRRSMQVCVISRSWALDSGLVAVFRRHPIAVYLKCRSVVFVILFGQRSALVCSSRFYYQTGRKAVLTREKL